MSSEQDKLRKRLDVLVKREDNRFCCDCGTREPRWASANLGIFICLSCSGIHRNLGVHISFVRSVNLDSWKVEQVEKMERLGNALAKEYYEANVPEGYRRPGEHASVREMEKWIRDKYEHKRFAARGPPPVGNTQPPQREQQAAAPSRADRERQSGSRAATGRNRAVQKVFASKPVAPQPVVDLLSFDTPSQDPQQKRTQEPDFGDFQQAPVAASAAPASAPAPSLLLSAFSTPALPQSQQPLALDSSFGDFQSAVANSSSGADSLLGQFSAPAPTPPTPFQAPVSAPVPAQKSADAIMSMYSVPYTNGGQMTNGISAMGAMGGGVGGAGFMPAGAPVQGVCAGMPQQQQQLPQQTTYGNGHSIVPQGLGMGLPAMGAMEQQMQFMQQNIAMQHMSQQVYMNGMPMQQDVQFGAGFPQSGDSDRGVSMPYMMQPATHPGGFS
jgi:stromal membrane-associated protein